MHRHVRTNQEDLDGFASVQLLAVTQPDTELGKSAKTLLSLLEDGKPRPLPKFDYDDGLAFALHVELDQNGNWMFKSDSLNGPKAPAAVSPEAAADLARFILANSKH